MKANNVERLWDYDAVEQGQTGTDTLVTLTAEKIEEISFESGPRAEAEGTVRALWRAVISRCAGEIQQDRGTYDRAGFRHRRRRGRILYILTP